MTLESSSGTISSSTNDINVLTDEIQRKIFGQRNEQLTAIEINRLFQSSITPEFNLLLYRALQREAINPDITILQIIPRAKTKEYLIPIALCLRFGADANLYVNAPNLGTIHILGYIYNVLGGGRFDPNSDSADENVINTIVLMFLVKGSRPSLAMYDRKAGKIRSEGEMPATSMSVVEWLNDQGYRTILDRITMGDPATLQNTVDADSLAILSILLDMPELMSPNRNYEQKDMLLAIRAFSPISFDKIPTSNTIVGLDYKSLDDSVTYLNSSAFEKLVKRGQLPSYILINKILINMRTYKNSGRILAVQELERMLISAVEVGTQLDQDQLSIISFMGKDILDSVMNQYEQPYWRKICRAPDAPADRNNGMTGNVPEPLRRLAISLNIDPTMSKSAICDNINTLSKADKESLKEAAKRRQQIRLAGNAGKMNEFLDEKIPMLTCRNKSLLSHDPFDYNDIDIAYYRDDQGALWCFSSDTFQSILESGVNPVNSTLLPESFKEQVRFQIEQLKRLGINAGAGEVGIYSSRIPITFSESIDSLSEKDKISEKTSEQALNSFIQLAMINGISAETIRNLSKDRMMAALRSIGYEINLTPLSTSHALVTTARIITQINRTDPDTVKNFFNSINTGSRF